LKKIGGEAFHGGNPHGSQGLLRRAADRARLREQILQLQAVWQSNEALPQLAPPSAETALESMNPVRIRDIAKLFVQEVAQCLGKSNAELF
jgi:hypothetical protein